jgi:nucleotide-binding universal stress UspA family protein
MQLLTLKQVLVAIDLAEPALAAIATAAQLASAAGATLHACTVSGTVAQHDASTQKRGTEELSTVLRDAGLDPEQVTCHVLSGDPALAIRALGDRVRADVVVLGPHRERASGSRSLGGTALALVTNAWSPVLIASSSLRLPLGQVLVPVDLSDTARGALLVGLSWASALRRPSAKAGAPDETRLTALNVHPPSATTPSSFVEGELAYLRESGGAWSGVSIHGDSLANANVVDGIVAFVTRHGPDLVVLGTRGLGLDPVGRLGSVAASVAQRVDVPLLLVPPALWLAHARASQPDAGLAGGR